MSEHKLTTKELVSTIQDSLKSVHQCMSGIDDLQQEIVENMEKIEELQGDAKIYLATIEEHLKKISQTVVDERPRSSLESLFLGSGHSEHSVSTTVRDSGNFPSITSGPEPITFPTPTWFDTDSPEARAAIESVQGPLSPGELKNFLDIVKLKKYPHKMAMRYTKNVPLLICQLGDVHRFLENIPATLQTDRKLESRLPTLIINLIRYFNGPGAKEQSSTTLFNYFSSIKSCQTNVSSSLISSSSTSSQENLKRKSEDFKTTPTKSSRFS